MKNSQSVIIVLISFLILAILFYAYFNSKNKNTEVVQVDEIYSTTEQLPNNLNQSNNSGNLSNIADKSESKAFIGMDGMYVVTYTDEGFVPPSIQIAKGKSIRFINQSSKGMRIFFEENSLEGIKEFNQPETVGRGSTYTMSFVEGGFWVYYNGAFPAHKANVLVY